MALDFFAGHPLYFDATQAAWTSFLTSLLTMLSIALAVYYTIQFINNKLIGSESEKWGYDEPHVDMMALQKLQKKIMTWFVLILSCKNKF